jgi:glycosyltransferase involved in cell wall biosynthesis
MAPSNFEGGATPMSRLRVSVLLPVRNAERWLPNCLESLFAQEVEGGMEIVALDHGSTDASGRILEMYAQEDKRLGCIKMPQAPSLPALLNAGLDCCQGRYIARMDGDDRCLMGRLEAQARLLDANPDLGLVGCQFRMFSDEGPVSQGYQDYAAWANQVLTWEDIQRELFVECPLPHPTWMLRREAAWGAVGYQDDGMPEDYHLLLRIFEAGWEMAKVPEVLFEWRDHADRHSRSHPRYNRQAFFKLKARYIATLIAAGRPCVVYGAGERARLLVRYLLEAGVAVAFGICLDSMPATLMHGVPVLKASQVPLSLPGPLLACVGDISAKPEIRAWAAGRGMKEGGDWWFVS